MTGYQNDSENFFCNGVFHLSRWNFFRNFLEFWFEGWSGQCSLNGRYCSNTCTFHFLISNQNGTVSRFFWDFEFFELIDSSILLDEITRKYTNKGESNTRNFRIRSYCTSSSLFRSIILRQGWSDEEGWSRKWSLGKSFRMMQYS